MYLEKKKKTLLLSTISTYIILLTIEATSKKVYFRFENALSHRQTAAWSEDSQH